MSAAAELSRARQRLGYSLDEISRRTKIKVERLRAIEEMDEEQFPTLVYLKGFLRAYAIEVQLDPDDVAHRYLAELASARVAPGDALDGAALPAGGASLHLHAVADDHAAATALPPPRPRIPSDVRYAAVLAVPILALLGGWMFWREFGSSANRPAPTAAEIREPSVQPPSDAATAANAEPRAVEPATTPPSAPPATGSAPAEQQAATPQNLSGSWTLTNRVRSASRGDFENLELGFQLKLQQQGDYVFGTGYKVSENGRPLAGEGRTPIFVEGTLNGRRLELTFTERGRRRTSGGTLLLDVAEDGTLRGAFASDAANARGASVARKVGQP
jgi:hypothetical protein